MYPPTPQPPAPPALPPAMAAPPAAPLTPAAKPNLPFDPEVWKPRLEASKERTQQIIEDGKVHVRRYRNKWKKGQPRRDEVAVPVDFTKVEQKRPQLFFSVPEVRLTGLTPESEAVAALAQAVLNQYLGEQHIGIKVPMDEILFDVLCPVGFGVICLGYEAKNQTIDDPQTQQPVTVPIWARYFAHRVSPGLFRAPAEFRGSDFDEAPWLGYRVYKDVPPGTPGASDKNTDEERYLSDTPGDGAGKRTRRVMPRKWGTIVWYRTTMVDEHADPNALRMFEWWDGDPEPTVHKDSPYQRVDPQTQKLTGELKFPIKVLTLRYVSDTAFPPSDSDITRVLVDERSRGRTQVLLHRDRTLPVTAFDSTTVDKPTMEKIERGETDGMIGIPNARADMFVPIQQADMKGVTYEFDQVAERDTDLAWALGPNQSGVASENVITATEAANVKASTDTRLEYERGKVALFFCEKIAKPVMTLIQMFADQASYVQMLGPQNAQQFVQWDKTHIQGEFSFKIKMNSQLRPDTVADEQRTLRWLNLSAQSPYVNQKENWKQAAQALGMDPSRLIVDPPAPKDEPPKLTISMSIKDIAIVWPQAAYAIITASMKDLGVEAPPTPPNQPPPNQPTTESAPMAPTISKHDADLTGQLDGMGSRVQQTAEGTVQ